jgi:putative transposase
MSRIVRGVRQAGVYFVTSDTWERRAIFSKPEAARIVLGQLLSCRERGFYKLHAFVIMPDHLHVLLTPSQSTTIEKAMQMIKGGSAHQIGLENPHRFPIWHAGFHDRWMRNASEYRESKRYIEQNPVVAKLAEKPDEYEMSSASGRYPLDPSRFDGGRG